MHIEALQALRDRLTAMNEPKVDGARGLGIGRNNEPEDDFDHPDEPRSATQIHKDAAHAASHFNMNVGVAWRDDDCIKGMAALALEANAGRAAEYAEETAGHGRYGTTEAIAGRLLRLGADTQHELFDGPTMMGAERAWITPAEAARAVDKALEGNKTDLWTHLDASALKKLGEDDDWKSYFLALGERDLGDHGCKSLREKSRAQTTAAENYAELFRITTISAGATIAPSARIGRGARIDEGAQIRESADIGTMAHVARNATVGPAAAVAARFLRGGPRRRCRLLTAACEGLHPDTRRPTVMAFRIGSGRRGPRLAGAAPVRRRRGCRAHRRRGRPRRGCSRSRSRGRARTRETLRGLPWRPR